MRTLRKRWRGPIRDVVRGIVAGLWAAQVRKVRRKSLMARGVADFVLLVAAADAFVGFLAGEPCHCLDDSPVALGDRADFDVAHVISEPPPIWKARQVTRQDAQRV